MRVLLISPRFHGYYDAVRHGFATLGHDVDVVLYDERSLLRKVDYKLSIELPERVGVDRTAALRQRTTARIAPVLQRMRPDVVLVIKGDELDLEILGPLRSSGATMVLWLQDELHRTHLSTEDLARFDVVASYSAIDVATLRTQSIDAALVPMAFDDRIEPHRRIPRHELVFVGARYPGREALLRSLLHHDVPVHAYGRAWSPRWRDRARTFRATRGPVPGGPDVDRARAGQLYLDADASLNIHGDGHDGFNPRTFEVCGVGGFELLDRTDVEDLYDPGSELITFESAEDVVDVWHRITREPSWADAIRHRARARTLADHTFTHRCRSLLDLC